MPIVITAMQRSQEVVDAIIGPTIKLQVEQEYPPRYS